MATSVEPKVGGRTVEYNVLDLSDEGDPAAQAGDDLPLKPQAASPDDDLDIQIVDDIPKVQVEEGPTDEELAQYTGKDRNGYRRAVQQRAQALQAQRQAEAERDAAVNYARQVHEAARRQQAQFAQTEQSAVSTMLDSAKAEHAVLKAQLQKAYESGDAAAVADLTDRMTDAKARIVQYSNYRPQVDPTAGQQPANAVQMPPSQPTPAVVPDKRALDWQSQNDWFNVDPEMTNAAFGVHEKLIRAGVNPTLEPDRYYAYLDKRMREMFPSYEWDTSSASQPQQRSAAAAPVAGVSRGAPSRAPKSPQRVQLSRSELAIANSLGLTPQQYAAEKLKLMRQEQR